jgi:Family of unknown function (DUF6049)
MTRPALLRAVVAPLLAAALAVLAPPAQAAPPAQLPAPAAVPADDDASDPLRPVRIEVGRFEPRTITPGAAVTVTGTVVNTGEETVSDLAVRLQRGEVITTRPELAAERDDQDPATAVVPSFREISGELEPGDELPFSYTVPSEELRLDRDGVYPALINVNGTVDGEPRRVGELRTYLVQQPVVPTARTTVAWLWPLVARTTRTPSGGFADDSLAESVAEGGRLDRVLAVLERLPSTVAGDGSGIQPVLSVTLAVDPAVVEALAIMAEGPYAVAGEAGAGEGTEAAAAFLERLRAVAAAHPVLALPYGDVDGDSLVSAGLPDVLTRSLPGTSAGTAQAAAPPPAEPDQATASATPTTGSAAPPTDDEDDAGTGAGAAILADVLGVEPGTDLAWAADGSLQADTVEVLRAGGVERLVLGTQGLTDGESAVGLAGSTTAAHTAVPTASGDVDVLVADPTLSAVVGTAEDTDGGARLAEQRYLAELAVITQQAPAGSTPTVLVAAPREVEAGPEGAGAMMADTAATPWLAPGTLDQLAAAPASPAGALGAPADAARLDPTGMADVVTAVALRDDLAGAVVGDAATALRSYDAAISRTTSVTWREDPAAFQAAAADLVDLFDRLRGRVTLLAPADGTYSLASSDAPLVLTVRNDLPFAVQVLLDLRTRGSRGLSISDIGVQTLAPGQRTTLQVPTEVRQSGGFAVTAALTTPSGRPLGEPVDLQVKSTAYGPISLIITIGAAALLGLLFLRRLVNFLIRRRRAAAATPPPADVHPPTRSPV